MRKTILIVFAALTLSNVAQTTDVQVKGPAKLIGSWTSGQKAEINFSSSTLDKFKIYQGQQGMYLTLNYKNLSELLGSVSSNGEKGVGIRLYECDLDNDKDLEYMAVFSNGVADINVKFYKISKGLVKLIGNFGTQFEIIIAKNIVSFPYGGQGFANEYLFRDDAFFELEFHDPNKK